MATMMPGRPERPPTVSGHHRRSSQTVCPLDVGPAPNCAFVGKASGASTTWIVREPSGRVRPSLLVWVPVAAGSLNPIRPIHTRGSADVRGEDRRDHTAGAA